jgi:Flp pilus assembly protein TadG
MLKNFLRNQDGNYAAIFAIAMLPLFGGVGLAVDYSNISRLKHELGDATDMAGLAVSKRYSAGGETDDNLKKLGKDFFNANFDAEYLSATTVTVNLPGEGGSSTKELSVKATLAYKTLFGPAIAALMGVQGGSNVVVVQTSTLKLKSLAEIALVMDNSGSMSYNNAGQTSGVPIASQRITLLKAAAKQLVDTMIDAGAAVQQVNDPVKFSIIPFSASVNIGAANATKTWMDARGVSPIHHEHINWGTPGLLNEAGYRSTAPDGAKLDGTGKPLTRFSIYNALTFRTGGAESTTQCQVWKYGTSGSATSNCAVFKRTGTLTDVGASSSQAAVAIASTTYDQTWLKNQYAWQGCVEMRPNGYDVTDDAPSAGTPATLFVPMFAPDDFNVSQYGQGTSNMYSGYNNWWPDYETAATFQAASFWPTYNDTGQALGSAANPTASAWWTSTSRPRMTNAAKYFKNKPYLSGQGAPSSTSGRIGEWQYFRGAEGPNASCTTTAITPLTGNKTTIKTAIDLMQPTGNTNVPEGLAWGWRTVSSAEPFSEGVAETRKDIDKVVIVLTDGANTYGDISMGNGGDVTGTQSTYAAFGFSGYAGTGGTNGTAKLSDASNVARIFQNTTASKTTHDSTNFQKAMDEKMSQICTNIKGKKIILMTVALDLDPTKLSGASKTAAQNAITALTNCAGSSRVRKDANGVPVKLFWNAKSTTLDATFKEIADELSNLRFTG